jgi:hypothetical protein
VDLARIYQGYLTGQYQGIVASAAQAIGSALLHQPNGIVVVAVVGKGMTAALHKAYLQTVYVRITPEHGFMQGLHHTSPHLTSKPNIDQLLCIVRNCAPRQGCRHL